jgi:transcriptional regulator with XRE-family HTH domain
MELLRNAIGEEIRRRRVQKEKTLRSTALEAAISLGYLSEVERGIKEPSSEILNAICKSLGIPISELILGVAFELAKKEEESGLTSIMI